MNVPLRLTCLAASASLVLCAMAACSGGKSQGGVPSAGPTSGEFHPYLNATYGYSLQQPSSLALVSGSNSSPDTRIVVFSNQSDGALKQPTDVVISVRVYENGTGISLEDWAARHPYLPEGTAVSQTMALTVGGEHAIQQIEDASKVVAIYSVATYVARANRFYTIDAFTKDAQGFLLHRSQYDAVLASFKFE